MEADELEQATNHPSGNGSGSTLPQESQTLAIKPSGSGELADRKATGPRTEQGKQRASRNSTKHGLLSKVIVLKGEPRDEYEELLTGLRETLQPEGTLEELLVEKLAVLAWRHRRLLLAEGAEIRKNMEFVGSDQRDRGREDAIIAKLLRPVDKHGLIGEIHNPHLLECCLELLLKLREQVEKDSFHPECDRPILEEIYGDRDENRLREDLYNSYEIYQDNASPKQCRKNFLHDIDEEIRRLKREQKARAPVQTVRTQLEI